MLRKLFTFMAAVFLAAGMTVTAQAALQAVGPVSADNGFPVWYEDENGLRLDLCLDQNGFCLLEEPNPGQPISFPDNFGPEAFWWAAEAVAAGQGINGLLVLALEAAFANEEPAEGDQVAFARIRIRVDVPAAGEYTVTHPFGAITFPNVTVADGINVTQDIGNFLDPGPLGDFTIALGDDPAQAGTVNADGRSIGPFLTRADGTVVIDPGTGNAYLSNPGGATAVDGSPFETNFFRIVGPGGIVAETSSFFLMGKVSGCDDLNVAPVANPDFAAALSGPTIINIVDNDTDDALVNPASIVIRQQGTKGTAVRNANGTVTYTPNPGAVGVDTFTYTIQDFCGLTSNEAMVTVLIEPAETLAANRAEYRSATARWNVSGTSTLTEPLVRLSGAEEVPANASEASGFAMVNINQAGDAIDYALLIDSAPVTDVTQAHIHVGARGVNGPIILFLCTNLGNAPVGVTVPLCPTGEGIVEGTLTAADLVQAGGITTFEEAIAAIRAGNTYVNVHTVDIPGGEIRGQIGNFVTLRTGSASGPTVGTAVVQPNQAWTFDGKSTASPGVEPRVINGTSTQGKEATVPLRLR